MTDDWTPILARADRDAFLATSAELFDITANLALRPGGRRPCAWLWDGFAGLALIDGYLRELDLPGAGERIPELVEAALKEAEGRGRAPVFGHGMVGLGWLVAHLENRGVLDCSDVLENFDASLGKVLDETPRTYGLAEGIVGVALYAAERRNHKLLSGMVAKLRGGLCASDIGPWQADLRLSPPGVRKRFPDGFVDLGALTGVTGVLAFAARVADRDDAEILLSEGVSWLLDQEDAGAACGSRFPQAVTRRSTATLGPRAGGYAYGDLAAAWAVGSAWARIGHCGGRSWRDLAIDLGHRAAHANHAGVGLATGTAGVAHALQRLARAVEAPSLLGCARSMLHGVHHAARNMIEQLPSDDGRDADVGLLTGAAGLAGVLAAAASEVPPSWDRCLLLS